MARGAAATVRQGARELASRARIAAPRALKALKGTLKFIGGVAVTGAIAGIGSGIEMQTRSAGSDLGSALGGVASVVFRRASAKIRDKEAWDNFYMTAQANRSTGTVRVQPGVRANAPGAAEQLTLFKSLGGISGDPWIIEAGVTKAEGDDDLVVIAMPFDKFDPEEFVAAILAELRPKMGKTAARAELRTRLA